jgi:pilus assembly protein CpaE
MTFAREIGQIAPAATVIAMYRPDRFDSGELESAFILEALRSGVQDFLRRPLSSAELRQMLDRLITPRRAGTGSTGTIFSFISNKGGVGKSTLSVNAACLLAERHPGEVLLIDAALQLGVCALMLDLAPQTTIVDAAHERERLDQTLLRRLSINHGSGLEVLCAPRDAAEAAEIDDDCISRILTLARRTFRYTVVDTFPVLDSTVITALDFSDLGYVVMQGTAPSVVGAVKLLPVLSGIGFPSERQRIVLNHNYKSFTGDLTIDDIEGRVQRRIDHAFPYQKKNLAALNSGVPYILTGTRRFGFGLAMMELIEEMESFRGEINARQDSKIPTQPENAAPPPSTGLKVTTA